MPRTRSLPPIQRITQNPADWPAEVLPLFERALTCEFATLTRQGVPITQPLTPYLGDDEQTLDVSTGLTYPAKAERARRNPKVAMLFSDAVSTGLNNPPIVLVYGLASVRDADLQANTDRYLNLSLSKSPAGFKGTPAFVLRQLPWYFARIWIQVQPLHILWWPQRNLDELPTRWDAPPSLQPRPSDPPPTGKQLPPWKEPPTDWHKHADHAIDALGLPILTTVDANGFPIPLRAKNVSLTPNGFLLTMPTSLPISSGPACLTFHTHPEVFTGQENKAFLGQVAAAAKGQFHFTVERPLADWSLQGSRIGAALAFFSNRSRLLPRLKIEAARRGQPVPTIHVPSFW